MATKITSRVIAPGAVTAEALAPGVGAGPVIANVQIANSSYVALDDTAVALEGGYILINGENFGQNTQVIIANTNATSVTYVSSSLVRAQVPAKSAGSYIMYLVNTDTGATAIRVNAVTYSGTPTWSTGSTLTEGAVDELISIQLSASSDTSVTYQLQTGSTLPSGLTLAANGLLSGTVTGLNEDTLYNFTIEAIDAENQDSPRSFSITITAGDQYINSTVLALNADNNTFITDASTNSFAITPNGDTRPSAFSPYNTSWSNYFDGTGDNLTFTKNTTTGSFTCECWFFRGEDVSGYHILFSGSNLSNQNPDNVQLQVTNTGGVGIVLNGTSVISTTGTAVLKNQWNHVAYVRSGTSCAIFVNGSRIATGTSSAALNVVSIGTNLSGYLPIGYISNARIVNDAVYDPSLTTCTVPTSPLTAITNTYLLTCQSNRLIDNSTNNFTITRNGDVRVTSFGPFAETDTTTGSGYFDGTGDFLTASSNEAFALGSGNFTIEFWMYTNSTSSDVISKRNSGGYGPFGIYISSANTIEGYVSLTGSSWVFTGSRSFTNNQWTHVALVRDGSTVYIYVDGTRSTGGNISTNSLMSDSNPVNIAGTMGNGNFAGYISNARIVKGTAVYTSAFTPPTSPLTAISGTSLLTLQNRISYNNSQPVDESGVKNIITRNGNTSVGSYTPHTPAGWSAYFDGTGDFLTIPDNAVFDFGSGAFIIEGWINLSLNNNACIIDTRSGSTAPFPGYLVSSRSDGTIQVLTENSTVLTGTIVMPLNTWNHFTVVRNSSSNLSLFINGVRDVTATVSTVFNSTTNPIIGAKSLSGSTLVPITGYLSNFRIIKGESVYDPTQSTLTVSNAPLEPIANTSLLTLRGPGFTDDGPNRFAITRNGDTRITPFSPFKTHTIVPDSHSVYFDDSGDYLSLPNDMAPFTSDWTIETWTFVLSGGTEEPIVKFYTGTTQDEIEIRLTTGNGIYFAFASSTGRKTITASSAFNLNEWNHFAFSREGDTIRGFVNGTLIGTNTGLGTYDATNTTNRIGTNQDASAFFHGYISNLRYVIGTSVYTTNFTPPTQPLTAISGTRLLTCQSSTVIDNSNNAYAITVNGNAQPTKFNPFGETITTGVQYSPASHGGSYYFDGTGDYLNTPATGQFAPAGVFTIECFVYITSLAAIRTIIGNYTTNATTDWMIDVSTAGVLRAYTNGSTARISSASGAISIGEWEHIVLSRNSSNVISLFLNGVLIGTYSQSGTFGSATKAIYIGVQNVSTNPMLGYISNLRMVESSALYTSAFVPPAAPPSPVAGTTLLLNGTGAAIADGVGKNVLETVGNARIINGIKKYGTGSMYFDGSGDYVVLPYNPDYNFGTGQFTIECWVNFSSLTGNHIIFDTYTSAALGGGYQLYWRSTGTSITFYANGGVRAQSSFTGHATDTWYHISCSRDSSGVIRIFINGTQYASESYSTAIDIATTSLPAIGAQRTTGTNYINGYIDDLRITKGVARYTSNFTPPTSSFKLK